MSKHEQVEDKRSRRVIGGIFGSVALAGIFAVGGFLLGNATADSAMGADSSDVLAQQVAGCLNTAETANFLAASYGSNAGNSLDMATDSSSQNNTDGLNLGSQSGVDPIMGFSFDTVITDNGDGGTVTPDPTVTPEPTVTPDPTPTSDPAPQPGDDCDHSGHGEHEGHGEHDESHGHLDGEHQSGDC